MAKTTVPIRFARRYARREGVYEVYSNYRRIGLVIKADSGWVAVGQQVGKPDTDLGTFKRRKDSKQAFVDFFNDYYGDDE